MFLSVAFRCFSGLVLPYYIYIMYVQGMGVRVCFYGKMQTSVPVEVCISACVGIPGLEPGITGPESVVLPITPYPNFCVYLSALKA